MKLKEYGFKAPSITDTHYVAGDGRILGASPIKPDGDWTNFLPKYEAQADKFETWGCVVFGGENQIETMNRFLFGVEPNFSERFIYNIVGIKPGGTDPQLVYEAIRRNGLINQEVLPATDSFEEFCKPRPMSEPYISEGKKWKEGYEYDHDWVLQGTETEKERIDTLRFNLMFSPLGVSVTAWFPDYEDKGQVNNHWCMLYKMDDKFYYIFDSYDHSLKQVPLTHKISYAKRIFLSKKLSEEKKTNILLTFWELLKRGLLNFFPQYVENYTKPVRTQKQKLIELATFALGTDISPLNLAPQEVSCSEGVSNLLSKVSDIPSSVLSTASLKTCLDDSQKFERITQPEDGCIIVSPRTATINGHTGIFLGQDIASNDSSDGVFKKNYTYNSWIKYFKEGKGLRIYLWRLKD